MINALELLREFRTQLPHKMADILVFEGVGELDVYNITAPFGFQGRKLLLGRVEQRDSEDSTICFFEETLQRNHWRKVKEAQALPLQDPFFTIVDQQLIIGGVEVFFDNVNQGNVRWRTCLYYLEDLTHLKRFFEGPIGMKDLRLKQLADGRILVLTRPQGDVGGRGKIGKVILNRLSELNLAIIEEAPLLMNQFCDSEWGGANEIYLLESNRVGVLGHIARFDEKGNRHYYGMSFELSVDGLVMERPKIIAERICFQPGPSKRPDLEDVVFSGGLVLGNESVVLYAGLSDAQAQKIELPHPFK